MTVSHKNLTDPELHEPKGITGASSGNVYVADGASSGAWQAHSSFADPNIHEPKGVSTALVDQVYVSDGLGSGSWTNFSNSIFSETFVSGTEVITSGGQTVLPHSLSGAPFDWTHMLQCVTSEHGYAAGNIIKPFHANPSLASGGRGVIITADAINLTIIYGSDASSFEGLHKTTGAEVAFTNGNWRAIFKAWR